MQTFILNDETKANSYGFRIPNNGIKLDRFKANPVMLNQHYNNTNAVIGKWNSLRVKGVQLLADPEFDTADSEAKQIEGKVSRGYIKGASMGVTFDRSFMVLAPDGVYQLTQCELFEVSIVAIPSNANAITLFSRTGELLSQTELKLSLQSIGLSLSNNINGLVNTIDDFEKLSDSAKLAFKKNSPSAYYALFSKKAKGVGSGNFSNPSNILSADDFEKLSLDAKSQFKRNNPLAYAALWK
jgi:HK97 family phage prohead protease